MKKRKMVATIGAMCLLLASCSNIDKLLKSNDFEAKYQAAMNYYNESSYSKAIQVFENLTLYYRGKEHAEDIAWYYAQALYKEKDYYTAGYQFRRFARQFPYSSERMEEALFLSAYCRYLDSPEYSLDQSLTKAAIEEFESFTENFPRSAHVPEANAYIDELRAKLIKKDFEIAYGYYFIEEYHAAYVSFKNFINLYPDAEQREEVMFYMLKSGYLYAINSREEKKRERLQQVVNDFERFSSVFSESKHLAESQEIYTKTRAALAQIEKDSKNGN